MESDVWRLETRRLRSLLTRCGQAGRAGSLACAESDGAGRAVGNVPPVLLDTMLAMSVLPPSGPLGSCQPQVRRSHKCRRQVWHGCCPAPAAFLLDSCLLCVLCVLPMLQQG